MGFLSTLFGVVGFGIGVPVGLFVGYFLFIYARVTDVEDPHITPIHELDSEMIESLLPEIPFWVKNSDYERVDWLNSFVLDMWPYLDKAICNIIRSTLRPMFNQYVGRFCIKSIDFDKLTLGSLPPIIHGVKVYDSNEKVLVFEPVIKRAGNPNISVVVKASSLQLTVQFIDMQIFMTPHVTLKPLVPTFPCFASIAVTLMEKPHIDFGLEVLGGDVMAIPGLCRYIQEMIKVQIASLYMWPKTLDIPILDNSSVAGKKPVGILHVKVVKAVNLLKMDILGKSDPYVKMRLSGETLSKKTSIKMCNLNPVWNEEFRLIVKDPNSQILELLVYDWEKVGFPDKLGMQVIPLSVLVPHERKEFTLELLKTMNPNDHQNRKSRGQLMLELVFEPFKNGNYQQCPSIEGDKNENVVEVSGLSSEGGLLSVWVQAAENVEGKSQTNPYALIIFRGERRKTKVIKRSRTPCWNEEFQLTLEESPTHDKIHIEVMNKRSIFNFYRKSPTHDKIHIEVMNKRSIFNFYRKESLGYVDINLIDVVNNGRINEKYHLINSKYGVVHVEMRWSV